MTGNNFGDMQLRHAMHVQHRQQQMSPRLTPTPPSSTSPVSSDYSSVVSSPHHTCMVGGNSESGILTQHLQQLQLQQQQQQTLFQPYTSPLHSAPGCSSSNNNSNSGLHGTSRPMGSIVQGTPIVSQSSFISTAPTSLGFFSLENSPHSGVLQRPHGGSITQGTPFNVTLMTGSNNLDIYAHQSPAQPTLVPVANFGAGSITHGTPVHRTGITDVEDQDMEEAEMGSSADSCQNDSTDEALDLSFRNCDTRTHYKQSLVLQQSEAESSKISLRLPSFNTTQPHPQISVTDEQGEVTDMSWSLYAQVSGRNGTCKLLGLSASSPDDLSPNALGSELHKSSSGSIEVQLSSDCSQLTVAEIFSLIEQSIHSKASGLVSCQLLEEDAAALLLERPGEDIHIAVEVSPPTGPEGLKGLKIRRISGDFVRYDSICNELIACISM